MNFREKTTCSACYGANLEEILDLPNFPLTGIYVESRDPNHTGIDQGFRICVDCGHGQLRNAVDPEILYDDTYTHRGGNSPIATGGNDFFVKFVNEVAGDRKFDLLLDIGCSDLYLLNHLKHLSPQSYGIDPVWIDQDTSDVGDINVIGAFVEDVDFDTALAGAPDLIVSTHTFEHVDEPRSQIERVFDVAKEGALIVIEVPGFDTMSKLARFDQVFHQHINHFSISSMRRLIQELGGTYVNHAYNYGFWGGTMITAFTKNAPSNQSVLDTPQPSVEFVESRVAAFRRQIDGLFSYIEATESENLYGYGAAQMLPALAYHMDSDLSFLVNVLDDDPGRDNLTWPDLGVMIKKPDPNHDYIDSNVIITAVDSTRPILNRCMELNFRRILVPFQVM